jgi:aminopeptidase N
VIMIEKLADSFNPSNYKLFLSIDKTQNKFTGNVVISGKLQVQNSVLKLHSKELDIDSAEIDGKPVDQMKKNKFDVLELHNDVDLKKGQHQVTIVFNGRITDPMHGMYPSNFVLDGKKKQLIATQFESHHAREVFPCVDEPAAKATFDLTLNTPNGEQVLANTPVDTQTKEGERLITTFETTPIMSTYLLAFVVGEVSSKEATTKDGVLVRCWATPDKKETLGFSLDVAVKTLEFYNTYFKIDYPLAKCDMVALPDFSSGAMENWGLITYRETCMLVDEKNTSQPTKQYVAMVVAHELAHQWFGNLVTMKWWNDLWLNEGFASWIEYLAVDHIFPDWQMWTQFVVDEKLRAQKLDALENTHPIEVEVNNPDEIRTIFDAISYQKGASVIGMLHSYLGADDFRNGLSHYLKRYKYANAETKDLWDALSEKSGKDVSNFMSAWTSQPGFPVIAVSLQKSSLVFTQQRFRLHPKFQNKPSELWPIPLDTKEESLPELFISRSKTIHWSKQLPIMNKSGLNLFLTRYPSPPLIKNESTVTRLQILSDSFDLAKAGYDSTNNTLDLLKQYDREDQAPVWDIMAGIISSIRLIMDTDEVRDNLKPLMKEMTSKQVERLGWDSAKNETYFDTLLRPLVLGLNSLGGEQATIKIALDLFDKAKKPEDLSADLRGVIYGTVVRERDDKKTYNTFLKWYDSSNSPEERVTIASALMAFKNEELLRTSIGELKKGVRVKPQDLIYWIIYGLRNRYARQLVWRWTKDNWDWILEQFGSDMHLGDFIKYPADVFSTADQLADYKNFFSKVETPGQKRTIQQGIEKIEINVAWRARDEKATAEWLRTYASESIHSINSVTS